MLQGAWCSRAVGRGCGEGVAQARSRGLLLLGASGVPRWALDVLRETGWSRFVRRGVRGIRPEGDRTGIGASGEERGVVLLFTGACLFFCLIVSHLRPMGLNVLLYMLPIPPTATLPSCLRCTKNLLILPRFSPYDFLSRCKLSTLTTRQPVVEFYFSHVLTLYVTEEILQILAFARIELMTSALVGVRYEVTYYYRPLGLQ